MGRLASFKTSCRSSRLRHRISDCSWIQLSPPLIEALMSRIVLDLRRTVLLLASELGTLQPLTGTSEIGKINILIKSWFVFCKYCTCPFVGTHKTCSFVSAINLLMRFSATFLSIGVVGVLVSRWRMSKSWMVMGQFVHGMPCNST